MPSTAAEKVLQIGDRVILQQRYTTVEGLTVKDSFSTGGEEFTLGSGELFDALEQALIGKKQGETIALTLQAEEAYGAEDEANVQVMSRDLFSNMEPLEPARIVSFAMPSGDELVGCITDLNEYFVEVDFNHPCAGSVLELEVQIKSILGK